MIKKVYYCDHCGKELGGFDSCSEHPVYNFHDKNSGNILMVLFAKDSENYYKSDMTDKNPKFDYENMDLCLECKKEMLNYVLFAVSQMIEIRDLKNNLER